jgi:hypothetical protein
VCKNINDDDEAWYQIVWGLKKVKGKKVANEKGEEEGKGGKREEEEKKREKEIRGNVKIVWQQVLCRTLCVHILFHVTYIIVLRLRASFA